MLKAMLALNKIHIPTQVLEMAIVMPRDLDNYHPPYPTIQDSLMVNPYRKKVETKKKKGKKACDEGPSNRLLKKGDKVGEPVGKLELTDKSCYKVYEFGNLPLLSNDRPKGHHWRMFLPADADWSGFEDPEEADTKGKQKDEKKKGKGKAKD